MAVRVGSRIEVRLDDAYRAKLAKVIECRGVSVSDFVRKAIDDEAQKIALAEWDELVDYLQQTATWTPSGDELDALLNDPQSPELEEHYAK